jgi:hydrogenase maturation protease
MTPEDLEKSRPLVVGLGSTDRGDDAIGPVVARAASARVPGRVRVVEREDPTALIDLWEGRGVVVVVDAMVSGAPPGTLHRLETGPGAAPLPDRASTRPGPGSTHGIGLGAVAELARALGRLPTRLVVVGVEAARFDHGAPLSAPVASAVEPTVAAVVAVLRDGEISPHPEPAAKEDSHVSR